ncbi:hypothetical protein BGZ63DRAFT_468457 [Mariannaea sp. PMI_226]|nr:hypothetical protein BGZ63DRAFT_468457 [Mariannaea sp. PMI_226]
MRWAMSPKCPCKKKPQADEKTSMADQPEADNNDHHAYPAATNAKPFATETAITRRKRPLAVRLRKRPTHHQPCQKWFPGGEWTELKNLMTLTTGAGSVYPTAIRTALLTLYGKSNNTITFSLRDTIYVSKFPLNVFSREKLHLKPVSQLSTHNEQGRIYAVMRYIIEYTI